MLAAETVPANIPHPSRSIDLSEEPGAVRADVELALAEAPVEVTVQPSPMTRSDERAPVVEWARRGGGLADEAESGFHFASSGSAPIFRYSILIPSPA